MKVRVSFTADVTDLQRRALGRYLDDSPPESWHKRDRLATRWEIADFFRAVGYENGDGVLTDYVVESEQPPPPPPVFQWVTMRKDPMSGEPTEPKVIVATDARTAAVERFGGKVQIIKTKVVRNDLSKSRTIGWVVPRKEKTT